MVGVPGRSKSCNTCRHRKIACSLEVPQCAQCIKSNRLCAGYQRERIFIQHQGANEDRGPKAYRRQTHTEIQNSLLPAQRDGDVRPPPGHERHSKGVDFSVHCSALQGALPKSVEAQPAYRQQLLAKFLHRCTPLADQNAQSENSSQSKGWLALLLDWPRTTRALEASLTALCTAGLGREHNDGALVKESTKLYGQGLWELQKALWDPKLMYRDETLAACMALFMYELVECSTESRQGLISHVDGCARLIQLRGAEAHCSILGHQLFLAFRLDGIIRALESNQSTYLVEQEWVELPWKGLSKSPHDQIIDTLVGIANVVGQRRKMIHLLATNPLSVIPQIVDECWIINGTLRRLYKDLESNNLGPLYWPKFSKRDNLADDPELGKVFPVAFHFPNLRTAHSCMLYWTASILLWSMLSPAYRFLQALQSDMSHLPLLEEYLDGVSLAHNICQAMEYCFQDEMGGLGPAIAMIPLHVVIRILKDHRGNSRELAWSKAVAQSVAKKGIRVSLFVPL